MVMPLALLVKGTHTMMVPSGDLLDLHIGSAALKRNFVVQCAKVNRSGLACYLFCRDLSSFGMLNRSAALC